MDALSFLQSVSGYAQSQRNSSADRPIKLATIDPAYDPWENYPDVPQLPRVQFDGESSVSTKRYPYVQGYIPVPGQRVYMLPIGTTFLIAGAVENTNLQGFYANPTTDYYSTEFGGGAYLEVEGGASNLVAHDVTADGYSLPRGIIGGNYYTGSDRVVGIINGEYSCNMETGTQNLIGGRLYHVLVKMKTYSGTNDSEWLFRVRENSISGTQRGEHVWRNQNASYGWSHPLLAFQYVPASNESKNFVLTAGRLSGSGTLNINTGGTINVVYMAIEDKGLASRMTQVT